MKARFPTIPCKILDCDRNADYEKQQVCQKHYFRFIRNGTYSLSVKPAKYRTSNPAGYQKLLEPDHPLADIHGRVYEHRFVYFNAPDHHVSSCSLCDKPISWDDCHIDHIDNNVKNNDILNLRATCAPCNVFRGHSATSMGKNFYTVGNITLTAHGWARRDDVQVSSTCIADRRRRGMSDSDAIYAPRKTSYNTITKKQKVIYDEVRGITIA